MTTATTFTLDPAMLFCNGIAAGTATVGDITYRTPGNGAFWRWTTSARKLTIASYAEYSSATDNNARIGVVVNGSSYFFGAPTTTGTYLTTVRLPPGVNKTVDLLVPLQFATSAGGARLGVYPYTVTFDVPATDVSPSLSTNHLVIYGDSIASGGSTICPSTFGYANLLRSTLSDTSVTLISHGTRRLADDCATAGSATAFVTSMLAFSPTKILVAIGSNDHSVIPAVTLANFTTYYERLLDEIHAQSSTMPIVCLSPIRRGAEGANANGNTMAQFRTAISDAVTARSGWAVPPTYEDGLAIFADLTLIPDQVHPNTAGHAALATAVAGMV